MTLTGWVLPLMADSVISATKLDTQQNDNDQNHKLATDYTSQTTLGK